MSHIWECREDEETARSADEEVTGIVIDWLHDEKRFEGTASELLEILHDALPCELRPNILSRWLNKHKGMLKANGVSYTLRRTRDSRTIRLSCDGNDANDDISWIGAASKIPSPSSQPSRKGETWKENHRCRYQKIYYWHCSSIILPGTRNICRR